MNHAWPSVCPNNLNCQAGYNPSPVYQFIPMVFSDYRTLLLFSGIGLAELVKKRINDWKKRGKQILKIVVVGKVGAGKSALINGLIGDVVAPEGNSVGSVTSAVNQYKKEINGVDVIIFDTPGFFDPKQEDGETLHEIHQETKGTIDLLLICMKMTDRLEQTHVLIIRSLQGFFRADAMWENSLIVLTFANEVRPQRTRHIGVPSQPEDQEANQELLKDHFQKRLSEFKEALFKYLYNHIPAQFLKEIPVVPAGYDDPNLPGYADWLSKFWVKAFSRASDSARIALMRISESRFMENPSNETMPPYLRPISMSVASAAIVGATVGRVVGNIKGICFSDMEIEEIRDECEKKGASLGARFVLSFHNLKTPTDYPIDWFIKHFYEKR